MTRISVTVDGVELLRRRRAADAARPVPPRAARQDRHRRRVRHQQLRRLHRAPRRPQREVVQRARRPGRRRTRSPRSRGWPQDGELHPMQQAFHECHALQCGYCTPGHDHAGDRPAQRQPEPDRGRRSATGSRATCAAAPATTTSSRPCRPPPGQESEADAARGGARHDRHRGRPAAAPRRSASDRRRKEDQRLITGRTRWTDNIQLPGMLHLAMVRSPFAHARITASTPARPRPRRTSSRSLTGADVEDEPGRHAQRLADHARPGRPRPTCRSPSTGSRSPARSSPSSSPARAAEARDAAELVDVDYEELPAVARPQGGRRGQGARAPRPRHQQVRLLAASTPPRPAPAATSTRPSRRPAPTASSSSASTASSGSSRPSWSRAPSVVDPTGEQMTMWSADPDPAHPALPRSPRRPASRSPRSGSSPPTSAAASAASCRPRRRSSSPSRSARRLGKPVKYTETRSESLMAAHHGRDQWQKLTLAADEGRHGHRPQGRAARRPRRLRRARRRRRPGARRVHVQRDLQVPGLPVQLPDGAHQQDLDRRLPRRRPARGDLRHRADDGRARRRGRRRPARDPREELDQARGVPVHHGRRAGVRLRQLRGGHRQGQGDLRLRRAAGRAEAAPRVRATRSSSASASRRSPRCAAWRPSRVLGSLDYGAGGWEHASDPDAADRQGRGRHRRLARTARATRRRGQPDRRRPARRRRSRTSRCCTATPRSRHKGMDTYGSRSLVVGGEALVRAADKVIEKAKPIAAHLLEADVDDIEFNGGPVRRQGHRQGRRRSAEVALATFAAHNLPDGVEPTLDADATYDPVNFSFPHGTHLCAMEVDTETGGSTMRKYVCVDDIGNIINPLIVDGPGARRPGPGHRPGAVGGGGVRRRRARWCPASFVDYLAADRGRHDQLRHRPHHVAVDDQHARHQGRRRGGHHRLDAGRRQRGRRRACGHFGVNDIQMPCTPERVWKAIHARTAPSRRRRHRGRRTPHFDERPATRPTGARRKEQAVIPAQFDYLAPTTRRGGARGARRARRRRQGHRRRAEPAAGAADAAQRPGDRRSTSAGSRRCAASATTATRSSSAR